MTPIWEGGSNIQALDLLEVMLKKNAHERFFEDMKAILRGLGTSQMRHDLLHHLDTLQKEVADLLEQPTEVIQYVAKDVLRRLGEFAMATLLMEIGEQLPAEEGGRRFARLAEFYVLQKIERAALKPTELRQWLPLIHPNQPI